MKTYHDLFMAARKALDVAHQSQRDNIVKAARLIGDTMLNEGIVQLFGIKTGHAFAMEMGNRAGGLVQFHRFNPEDLVLRKAISHREYQDENLLNRTDLADKFWNIYNIDPRDMFILISEKGIEQCIIDVAIRAKEEKRFIVVVTSMKASKAAECKHDGQKKLYEYADVVLDFCSEADDRVIDLDGNISICQVSTITGNAIAQMLTAEIYRYITNQGLECPVLISANVKGSDEINRRGTMKYEGRFNA